MSTYTQYSQAWLEDQNSIPIILVEAQVLINSVLSTVYFSTDSYTSADGSVTFLPLISKNITSTESISIDNSSSMVISDLELINNNSNLDTYLDNTTYVWSNQPIAMYLGDSQWRCTNITDIRGASLGALTGGKFSLIFNGIIDDIDCRSRNSINIKFRDKLERLNTPLTEEKLGPYGVWPGIQQNQDQTKPIIFGEVFNMTPMLVDPSRLKYQFNKEASAGLIEVRDTGMPLLPLNTVTNLTANILATVSTAGGITSATGPANSATVNTGGAGWITGDQVYVIGSSTPAICQCSSALLGATSITINTVFSGYISIGMQLIGNGISNSNILTLTGQTSGSAGGIGTYTLSSALSANIVSFTTLTGINVPSVFSVTASSGVVSSLALVIAGSGITSGNKTMGLFATAVTRTATVVDNNIGQFILGLQASGTVTCSAQGTNNSLNLATGNLVIDSYSNGIAENIGLIVTQYGKNTTKLSSADIDLVNFQSVATTAIPICVVVTDNLNILNVIKQLTSSINSQAVFTRTGLLKILRYGVGYNTDRVITSISEADITYGTLSISKRLPLIGAIKIGYAKNYSIQSGLVVNIPQAHKNTFADEYLSVIKLNQSVIQMYKLSNECTQINTQLLTEQTADDEAFTRLNYYSVQHTVYKFTGTRKLLSLVLGQSVNLMHSRFGLYNGGSGVQGQVVTLAPNWSTGLIDVEVVI